MTPPRDGDERLWADLHNVRVTAPPRDGDERSTPLRSASI